MTEATDDTHDKPIERLSDADFKAELASLIPHLRAFGRSLSGNRDMADDLVQETLLKAWKARSRYQAGTNMRAWTFIILRNLFLSYVRRARFTAEWDDLAAERILFAPAGQDKHVELADVNRALQLLPNAQREALILIGAGGFSYEEAAEICGVAVGTIKSRVARGRIAVESLLEGQGMPPRSVFEDRLIKADSPFDAIMDEVARISGVIIVEGR